MSAWDRIDRAHGQSPRDAEPGFAEQLHRAMVEDIRRMQRAEAERQVNIPPTAECETEFLKAFDDAIKHGVGWLRVQDSLTYIPVTLAEVCPNCENGGWECYGLGHGDPHFRECTVCGNPEGLECP